MTTQEKSEKILKWLNVYTYLTFKYQIHGNFNSAIDRLFLGLYITEKEVTKLKAINLRLLNKKDSKNEQILLINLIYNLLETNKLL